MSLGLYVSYRWQICVIFILVPFSDGHSFIQQILKHFQNTAFQALEINTVNQIGKSSETWQSSFSISPSRYLYIMAAPCLTFPSKVYLSALYSDLPRKQVDCIICTAKM